MILYNVTINIDDSVKDEWLQWMKDKHIPDVLATELPLRYNIYQLLTRFDEETGTTFSIQYFFEEMTSYEIYQQLHAPYLQNEVIKKYDGKFTAFRTVMEEV